MANLVIALVILFGGWWALRQLGNAQPAKLRALMRKGAGAGLIAVAGLLALRGALQIAAPIFLLGLSMFGQVAGLFNSGAFWRKPGGQTSRVSTRVLEMELDHDSGRMDGTVLLGPLAGRRLSSLDRAQADVLRRVCLEAGDQSLALFATWIERTHPEWQTASQRSEETAQPRQSAAMTREEALEVLGLKSGATPEEIRTAHKHLMKQFHPDRGGTNYLATKINLAKDRLLQD